MTMRGPILLVPIDDPVPLSSFDPRSQRVDLPPLLPLLATGGVRRSCDPSSVEHICNLEGMMDQAQLLARQRG